MTLDDAIQQAAAWQEVPQAVLRKWAEVKPAVVEHWAKEGSIPLDMIRQYLPADWQQKIPTNPGPLVDALVGGLAGAGIGYAGGWLGDRLTPGHWQKGRLPLTGAMLGGLLGAGPGGFGAMYNHMAGKPLNTPFARGYDPAEANKAVSQVFQEDTAAGRAALAGYGKTAMYTDAGLFGGPPFDPNAFNDMLWSDPRVGRYVPLEQRAMASGLVTAAANLPGKQMPWVTPYDVARVAAGMGVGYLSGAVVGKALSTLMGASPAAQERLKDTGLMAGAITALVPLVFQ